MISKIKEQREKIRIEIIEILIKEMKSTSPCSLAVAPSIKEAVINPLIFKINQIFIDEPEIDLWTRVEDEPPKKNGEYLVSIEDYIEPLYSCHALLDFVDGEWNIEKIDGSEVTHWMSLPPKPELK